ncbi:uncharacterized protein PITG_22679 [Phytophthora infestans T30-4]|uniref:Uncharacterized protein n=1 Tax=Phytophthora infestans (strain T30-4) TaxID=403677 RepID=D0MVA6_PHYIT|nr:uncharacterized protein PITG_22679 [Phytophthora infestans T30-4]EEY61102.1 conserved hypothetical protein [Phytophthora infestans T30-4]|eukprot:XP_002908019.1 conserved hypothetical protein [Phytophthora infestans T30-4]
MGRCRRVVILIAVSSVQSGGQTRSLSCSVSVNVIATGGCRRCAGIVSLRSSTLLSCLFPATSAFPSRRSCTRCPTYLCAGSSTRRKHAKKMTCYCKTKCTSFGADCPKQYWPISGLEKKNLTCCKKKNFLQSTTTISDKKIFCNSVRFWS